MSKFPELTDEEISNVLLYGGKPKGYGYTIQDYINEWNERTISGKNLQTTKENNHEKYPV